MAFQTKDFVSITASMLNWFRAVQSRVTDFNVGSVARTLIGAPAAEIDELYQQYFIGLKEAIPVSVYNTFDFSLLPAAAAVGNVRFSCDDPAPSDRPIPVGTAVRVPGKTITYLTLADSGIAEGSTYVDILCAASVVGSAGNTGTGTITELVGSIEGVDAVTNTVAFTSGADLETEDQRKVRFTQFIASLARGTVAAVEYGARLAALKDLSGQVTERVAYARVVEPYLLSNTNPIALVQVHVHNGVGSTSGALASEAKKVIDGYYDDDGVPIPGWKAAGVQVEVLPATDETVDVTAVVTVDPRYETATVLGNAEESVRAYIQGLEIGAKVILSEIIAIIRRDVEGTLNVVVSVPSADTTVTFNRKPVPGTITLTAA